MRTIKQLNAEIAKYPAAQMAMRSGRTGCLPQILVISAAILPGLLWPPLLVASLPAAVYGWMYVKRVAALDAGVNGLYFACPYCGRAVITPNPANSVCRACGRVFPGKDAPPPPPT